MPTSSTAAAEAPSYYGQGRTRVAVKAYIFKGDPACGARLLVLKRPPKRHGRGMIDTAIDLPGGLLEFGESWEQALMREVSEETQLCVELGAPFRTWSAARDGRHMVGVDYLARWIGGDVHISDEHTSARWMSLEELRALHDPEIAAVEEAFERNEQASRNAGVHAFAGGLLGR